MCWDGLLHDRRLINRMLVLDRRLILGDMRLVLGRRLISRRLFCNQGEVSSSED